MAEVVDAPNCGRDSHLKIDGKRHSQPESELHVRIMLPSEPFGVRRLYAAALNSAGIIRQRGVRSLGNVSICLRNPNGVVSERLGAGFRRECE